MNKLLVFCLLLISLRSYGQAFPQSIQIWSPPVPAFSQKFDWLKLKSGEWLKGEIVLMYDDELEFESDKFDTLIFDWEDVSELRSRFDQRIRFENGEVKEGFLIVKDDHLILISNGKEEHYPLSELLSITSSADDRRNLWTGKISLGVDINSGNQNQIDYTLVSSIQRNTPFTRFNIDYTYSYSKSTTDGSESTISDSRRLTSYIDWLYTSDIFFRVADYEFYSDIQQNIHRRNTLGFSVGYHIIDNKRLQWDVTLGPSFQKTSYYDDTANQDSGVIALSLYLDYNITSRLDYIFDYQLQFVEESSGKRNTSLNTGFEYEIQNNFKLDTTFYLDRVAEPVASDSNSELESNDYRLVISLAYDF